jgi:hypothetical protein
MEGMAAQAAMRSSYSTVYLTNFQVDKLTETLQNI